MPTALTIAGSDSGAGAGIQADLKTFAAHGVYGTSAITALTAQNTLGVTAIHVVPDDFVTAQIEAVVGDIGCDAVKTGMLANSTIVEAVAAAIESIDLPNLVVDPVMVAKSGDHLLDDEAVHALRWTLLRLARVVTPNIPEAEVLAKMTVRTRDDMREAAQADRHAQAGRGRDQGRAPARTRDRRRAARARRVHRVRRARASRARNTHGTGCTFAAAIAAHLAKGVDAQGGRARGQGIRRRRDAPGHSAGQGPSPAGSFLEAILTG